LIRKLLLTLLLLGIVAGGVLFWAAGMPYAGYTGEVFVDIPPGTGTSAMARMLTDAGVVGGEWRFLLVRALQPNATLQAGEYKFDRPLSAFDVFGKIARGDVHYYVLTVPEGANMFEIAEAVEKLGTMKREEFLKVARDPGLIRDIAPSAPSLEGFLFPSTYRLTRRTTAAQLAREMTSQFRKVWQQHGAPGADVNRIVTLASLVEKETGVPAERRTVASVYQNRLNIGMKLDCDPTTIYAALLEGRYRGTIYRSDLDNPHPYNTYRNPGLPPGAIANPGVESIKAAINPAETSYLFFVARGDGSGAHVFTENLSQHNAAVQDYRNATAR
jgi:UPF0755 protein